MEHPASIDIDAAVRRLAERDATLFADPELAAERLGWIGLPKAAEKSARGLASFARAWVDAGVTDVVLLGMGGSSIAPLVLARVIGSAAGYPGLHVLDTTSPGEVSALLDSLDAARTRVVVSSKSGTTVEPITLARVFLAWMARERDGLPGTAFVAVTDPGSPLDDFASANGFDRVFHAPADVGGRYSALSVFAMLPAAIMGIDVATLAAFAESAEDACAAPGADNPASALAAWMRDAYRAGRDKLTLVFSPPLAPFALWIEQLVAESTGKRGGGILPVIEQAPGAPGSHAADRMTFVLRTPDDTSLAGLSARLPAGEPLFESVVDDAFALAAQFALWEWAVALACASLAIEPFDQPDVEEAKAAARLIARGENAPVTPKVRDGEIVVTATGDGMPAGLGDACRSMLGHLEAGSYLAVLAYLPEDEATLAPLRDACAAVATRYRVPVTLQLGPRYLHSTGQYHKGGPATGVFLVITARDASDVSVPDADVSLSTLYASQAAGDAATLRAHGRVVVTAQLPDSSPESVRTIARALESVSF